MKRYLQAAIKLIRQAGGYIADKLKRGYDWYTDCSNVCLGTDVQEWFSVRR